MIGEPGLGKTRLVRECRRLFMAWVGARSGRLPLWLEGHGASYASSSPYGLYQQMLTAWLGVPLEEGEDVVRPALERAMKALFGNDGTRRAGGPAGPDDGFPPATERRLGPAQPRASCSARRLRRRALSALQADGERPHSARARGPALGRPDLAPPDRGALALEQ